MTETEIRETVRAWVETVVIGLGLCPFAREPARQNTIRYRVTRADQLDQVLADVAAELDFIAEAEPSNVATTILILAEALADFAQYNDALALVDELIAQKNYEGLLQVASFHPDYQFAGTKKNDVTNYTNRSPLPLIHILREADVTRAVEHFPMPEAIAEKNMQTMQRLGRTKIEAMLVACRNSGPTPNPVP